MRARLSLLTLLFIIPVITFSQHLMSSWKLDSTFVKRLDGSEYWDKRRTNDNATVAFKKNGKYQWITYTDGNEPKVTHDSGKFTLRISYRFDASSDELKKRRRLKKNVERGTYKIQGDSLLLSDGSHWYVNSDKEKLYIDSFADFFEPPRIYRMVFIRKRNDDVN